MPGRTSGARSAIGFRVRSGRAVAVLLTGTRRSPQLADCRIVLLSDPAVAGSVQPFHAALRQHRLQNLPAARPLIRVVRRAARRAVTALLQQHRREGHALAAAAIVVGSLIDPATIGNEHMRAHALEGQLFRTVLDDRLRAAGLRTSFLLEREAYSAVSRILARRPADLKRAVTALGRGRAGPWRADEKLAALAAWTQL